ncbi:MAG TPA: 3'-5' exonuclease [Methanosarcina sp.]|nr:3'-5' exonuclease [Methanosarcina sp.]
MRALIFDTETTGLILPSSAPIEKQPHIIELGVVVVEDNKLISEHNWLINPECEITAEITKITGITNDMVADKPLFRELLGEIEEVFGGADVGIAHNMPFDEGMLKLELERCARTGFPWPKELICTVAEYIPVFGKKVKLTALYETIMGVPLAQTHRASDDAKALFEVLQKENFLTQLML